MSYKVQPWKHQLNAISIAETTNELALFFDMGTGKTATTINILRVKYNTHKKIMRTLIFAPLVVCENWRREFEIHSGIPRKNTLLLNKSGEKRISDIEELAGDDTIIITNYESLRSEKFYKKLLKWAPEILVCDESHLCKNHKAMQTKRVLKLGEETKYRYILTGTPILNSALDIFSQFLILDHGQTFGTNYFVFRSTYFKDENARWAGRPGYFPKWVPKEELYPELNKKIYSKALRVTKKECLDLPPLVKQVIEVELSSEQMKLYKEMERDLITFIQNSKEEKSAVIAQLAVTKALRLQQIVTGFVQLESGEIVEQEDVPRLEVLSDLIDRICIDNKVIVWCSFRHNYKQVERLCASKKIGYGLLTGSMSVKEKQESMDRFQKDNDCRVMIANRKAGGIGVNLTAASYSIVYSRNFSLSDELQSEARNFRSGSEIHEKITKIDLAAKDTIDIRVLESLSNKEFTSEQIIGWFK